MKQQVLSVEQMQHLQELGVDTSKASCYWWYAEGKNYLYWGKCSDANGIPTFNLQDMLEMMPKYVLIDGYKYFLYILPLSNWVVKYDNLNRSTPFQFVNVNLICATYKCLCWLAENGYLKGGKK